MLQSAGLKIFEAVGVVYEPAFEKIDKEKLRADVLTA